MSDVYRCLADDPDREQYIDHALPWVYLANKPYLDWLFDGEAHAKAMLDIWMRREVSENSLHNIWLYFRDGEPYGGLVALTGSELVRARKADALSLMRDVPADRRPAVLERLKACSHLFDYPGKDEYYLAKMGVVQKARGTGIGKKIFGSSIENGAALGYKKFRGDVHIENIPALRLYESFGFVAGEQRVCEASGLAYVPVTLDRTKA